MDVKIVCSVIPGFESVALRECKERLGLEASRDVRGRITFDIAMEKVKELTELRSVHHYWVVVSDFDDFFKPEQTKEKIFEAFAQLPSQLDWSKALKTWKIFRSFKQKQGNLEKLVKKRKKNESCCGFEPIDYETSDPEKDGEKVRFRATATRTGNHVFSSMECACHIGGGVNDLFNWKVDLKKYDLEVVVYIVDSFISIGIQLTKESQSLRNITHFGPTTLKSNIAYCLLRSTLLKAGEIICDPMCGGGSIPLEGAYSFPANYFLGGDNNTFAMNNTAQNMESLASQKKSSDSSGGRTLNLSGVHWDVYNLPLRDGCIDHFVTDLPFGKKIGNKERNMFLYPRAMKEMARVCRIEGRAILLTHHKQVMKKALGKVREYWRFLECRSINMGGLNVAVYMLMRTDKPYVRWVKPNTVVEQLSKDENDKIEEEEKNEDKEELLG